MKNFRLKARKQIKWLCVVFVLTLAAILANMSQTISITQDSFHFGEMILVMFNDSYTGYYVFPFLLGFILPGLFSLDQNISFQLIRYGTRQKYYYNSVRNLVFVVLLYISTIVIFSFLSGFGNSEWSFMISDAFHAYSKLYLYGQPDTSYLLFEVIKTILLHFELFLFYALLQYCLLQLFRIKVISFLVYNGLVFVIAAMAVGFFGTTGERLSINSLAGMVYPENIGYIFRLTILMVIDFALVFVGRSIVVRRDISLSKGNKQYQEE